MADKTESKSMSVNLQEESANECSNNNSDRFMIKINNFEKTETKQTREKREEEQTFSNEYRTESSILYLNDAKNNSTKNIKTENMNIQQIWSNNTQKAANDGSVSVVDLVTKTQNLKKNEVTTKKNLLQGDIISFENITAVKKKKNYDACRTVLKKIANENNFIGLSKNITASCNSKILLKNEKMTTNFESNNLYDIKEMHLESTVTNEKCHGSFLNLTHEKEFSDIKSVDIRIKADEMNTNKRHSGTCVSFNDISKKKCEIKENKKCREKEKDKDKEKRYKKGEGEGEGEEKTTRKTKLIEEHISNSFDKDLTHQRETHDSLSKGNLTNELKKKTTNEKTQKSTTPECLRLTSDMKHIKDTISLQYEKYKRKKKRKSRLAKLRPIYYREPKSSKFFNSYNHAKFDLTCYESEVNDYLSVISNLHSLLFKERENYEELRGMMNYTTSELENEKNKLFEELNVYKNKYNRLKRRISNIGYGSILNMQKGQDVPLYYYKNDSKGSKKDFLHGTNEVLTNGDVYADSYVIVNNMKSTRQKKDKHDKIRGNNVKCNALLKFIDF